MQLQRCVDDILRPYVGKLAYVYIDNVLINSSTLKKHIKYIEIMADVLCKANLRLSIEKSRFFKSEKKYQGYINHHNKITVDSINTKTIEDYPIPQDLKSLREYLRLA